MAKINKLLQSMVLAQVNVVDSSIHAVQQVAETDYVGCDSPHNTNVCPFNMKTITYVKNDLYSNTYNESWRNHSSFSWGGSCQGNQGPQSAQGNYRGEAPSYPQRHYDKPHH